MPDDSKHPFLQRLSGVIADTIAPFGGDRLGK
jgi:hypothetical protein